MQAVVLASDRYEASRSKYNGLPRALLPIAGRTVLDHLLRLLFSSGRIESVDLSTDREGYPFFLEWLRGCDYTGKVEIFSNGCAGPSGPVADIFNITSKKPGNGDFLVVSGDQIFDFTLEPFLRFCGEQEGDVVAVERDRRSPVKKMCGALAVTSAGRVIEFRHTEEVSGSDLTAFPLVGLSAGSLPFLHEYISEGNDTRCIGSFLQWSYRKRPLYAFRHEGERFQIFDAASFRKISAIFEKKA